ncbi:MAG: hypothetical protein WDN46_24475 [Methylocella sp.]
MAHDLITNVRSIFNDALQWGTSARMNTLRLALLSLATLVALFLGWNILRGANRPPETTSAESREKRASPQQIAAARHSIEDRIAAAPEYAEFFARLKGAFPGEYEAFLMRAAGRSAAAGEFGSADALMIEAARALRLSRGVLAAKADGPALDHFFGLELAMLQALASKDQRLCVDFLYGGANGDFLRFSSEHRDLSAAMVTAGLDAIHDGQSKKVERDAPSAADFQVLDDALREKGLGSPEIEALLDGKAPAPPIEDGRMCRAGEVYLETLATMPEAARLRIYGLALELMARS